MAHVVVGYACVGDWAGRLPGGQATAAHADAYADACPVDCHAYRSRPAPTATASANLNVKLENTLGTGWTRGEVIWSPDSRFVAVTFWADTLAQTYVVDSRTGESFELTTDEGNVGLVAWSPDGKRIAGVSGGDMDSERQGIWSFAGGYTTKLLGGVCEDLAWSPDGNTLVATCELVVREPDADPRHGRRATLACGRQRSKRAPPGGPGHTATGGLVERDGV